MNFVNQNSEKKALQDAIHTYKILNSQVKYHLREQSIFSDPVKSIMKISMSFIIWYNIFFISFYIKADIKYIYFLPPPCPLKHNFANGVFKKHVLEPETMNETLNAIWFGRRPNFGENFILGFGGRGRPPNFFSTPGT